MFIKHIIYWICNALGLKRKGIEVGQIEKYKSVAYISKQIPCICGWNRWKTKIKGKLYQCRGCGKLVTNIR